MNFDFHLECGIVNVLSAVDRGEACLSHQMNETNQSELKGVMDREDQMILSVLSAVEEEPELTQKDLAVRLGVAVGMVNSYLKRVIYKGYVKTRNLQRRRLKYLLTPNGIKEKTRLTYEFLEYSYQYIRDIRRKTRELLEPYCKQGKKRVVFYGSGEVAELALLTVQELGMELVAVVDEQNKSKTCINHEIFGDIFLTREIRADLLIILPPLISESVKQAVSNIPNKENLVILTLNQKTPLL